MFTLNDKDMAQKIMDKLSALEPPEYGYSFMHVCGTHQDTLVKHGLDVLLADAGVRIRQGPGCPVCVTTPREIEEAVTLARAGKTVAVFGDMLKVPGATGSLQGVKAEGGDVRVVYSIEDGVKMARENPSKEVVFIAIGFETTAPTTAAVLAVGSPPQNFSVLCCHRTVPNALRFIAESGEVKLNGLIQPGHVSVIIGSEPYQFLSKEFCLPQVIAGFEPLDLLMATYMLARQLSKNEAKLENEYTRAVHADGNPAALKMMEEAFVPVDMAWRGFPTIPQSGLELAPKYEASDTRKRFEDELAPLKNREFKEAPGCKCGEVLRGLMEPEECPLFGNGCTPSTPIGPCMVSFEGGCAIAHKYGKNQRR